MKCVCFLEVRGEESEDHCGSYTIFFFRPTTDMSLGLGRGPLGEARVQSQGFEFRACESPSYLYHSHSSRILGDNSIGRGHYLTLTDERTPRPVVPNLPRPVAPQGFRSRVMACSSFLSLLSPYGRIEPKF